MSMDASTQDTRSQAERIRAGDAPVNSVAFISEHSGRIDVPAWMDIETQVTIPLATYARSRGLDYHISDRDDVLRAVGRNPPPGMDAYAWQVAQLSRALAAGFQKYDERAASE